MLEISESVYRCPVKMLFSNVEGMAITSTVLCLQKGSVSKIQVPCDQNVQQWIS